MKKAEADGEWNAACLNAIHCTISSADAVTVFYLGMRSTGQGHEEATKLLAKTGLESVNEKIRQFSNILRLKTLVEYDAEEPTENEASRAITQASRFYQWAKTHLEKP